MPKPLSASLKFDTEYRIDEQTGTECIQVLDGFEVGQFEGDKEVQFFKVGFKKPVAVVSFRALVIEQTRRRMRAQGCVHFRITTMDGRVLFEEARLSPKRKGRSNG